MAQILSDSSYPITSAQGKDGHSQVFFVNENGTISYWVSREEPEKSSKNNPRRYVDDYIQNSDGDYYTSASKDLDAVSYKWNDVDYTRLYYADQNNVLGELCLDTPKNSNSGHWFPGSLGDAKVKVKANSPISAHVNLGTNPGKDTPQLKVYFFAEGADRPSIVSQIIGTSQWLTKTI